MNFLSPVFGSRLVLVCSVAPLGLGVCLEPRPTADAVGYLLSPLPWRKLRDRLVAVW